MEMEGDLCNMSITIADLMVRKRGLERRKKQELWERSNGNEKKVY